MIFDTIILGSSITGSTLASILGRHGYRVLLLDRGRHPRFALGEAMVAQTSFWLWLLSERYRVPEIKLLSNTRAVAQAVSRSCGIKRSVGFVHHHEGQVHDPDESTQIVAPEVPFTSESHLYRQDIDR